MQTMQIMDAPAALGFVTAQRSHIETEVLRRPMPEITYSRLIPVDTSAPAYAPSVTFFSQDAVGRAKFINGKGDDIPLVNIMANKFEQTVNMAGVGYSFSLEEIGAAQQLGMSLSNEGAMAARMAYEQLVDDVAFVGNTVLGIQGLFNTTGITTSAAGQTFAAATPQQILATINTALTGIMTATQGIERADTIILPLAQYGDIATRQIAADSSMTVLQFIQQANVFTAMTGQPLTIIGSHRLTNTMVVYRRSPEVLKLHMPMPLTFIPPQYRNLEVVTLGMFRFAPVSIRRPGAMRYVTGIA